MVSMEEKFFNTFGVDMSKADRFQIDLFRMLEKLKNYMIYNLKTMRDEIKKVKNDIAQLNNEMKEMKSKLVKVKDKLKELETNWTSSFSTLETKFTMVYMLHVGDILKVELKKS
jgi:predicted nuclease with TOPRIM domain